MFRFNIKKINQYSIITGIKTIEKIRELILNSGLSFEHISEILEEDVGTYFEYDRNLTIREIGRIAFALDKEVEINFIDKNRDNKKDVS